MRLHFGQRPKTYDRSAALDRVPCLPHGSAQPHFRQRICQPDACFFAAMTFSAAVLAIESLALMSQQFLHFSESTGELFLQQKFPGESGFICPVASRNAPLNSSRVG
jgi:hypothetical protein